MNFALLTLAVLFSQDFDLARQTYFRIGTQVFSHTNGYALTRNVLEVNTPIPNPAFPGTFQVPPGRILLEFSRTNSLEPDVWLFQFLHDSAGRWTNYGYKVIHRAGTWGAASYLNTNLIKRFTNVFTLHMAEFKYDQADPLTGKTNATLRSLAVDCEVGELRYNSFWNAFKNQPDQMVEAF